MQEPLTRRSPALEALFGMLHGDGRHCVLDLGEADGRRLRLLGRFARSIRFAGLLPRSPGEAGWVDALYALPANAERPYDVVLAWDLLDRLPDPDRPAVVARLAEISAPGARLYCVVDASGAATTRSPAFTLLDLDRVSQLRVGPEEVAQAPILPAQVERILAPFRVIHAFTLRSGLREYVAARRLPS